jgi:hypothetical protein
MKKSPLVILSKVLAVLNIVLSIIIFFVSYITLRNYIEVLEPKGMASYSLQKTIIPLIIYAVLSLIAATLFLLNKKIGWWFLTIFTILFAIVNMCLVTEMVIKSPAHYNLKTHVIFVIFYITSTVTYLSKPIKQHFNVYRKLEEEIPDNT